MKIQSVLGAIVIWLFLSLANVFAQSYPFPHHTIYTTGSIKPTGTQAALDGQVKNFYLQWKTKYLKNMCGGTVVDVNADGKWDANNAAGNNTLTVSEAHGYGMLILVQMAGYDMQARTLFDGMYKFFRTHPAKSNPHLIAWLQTRNCQTPTGTVDGTTTATDGDLDIAYALLMAHKQWGSSGAINYLAEAKKVIAAIKQHEFHASTYCPYLGDWVIWSDTHKNASRLSDWMPNHFAAFYDVTKDSFWANSRKQTVNTALALQEKYSLTYRLVPDFVINGTPAPANFLEAATDGAFAYNSHRVPWRMAEDFLLRGNTNAKKVSSALTKGLYTLAGGKVENLKAGYKLNGQAALNYEAGMTLIAPLTVGAMTYGKRSWMDQLWKAMTARRLEDEDYFGNTLKMLTFITVSGNTWQP